MTDRAGALSRYKIVDPSFHNWFGLAMAMRNRGISDFPLCIKSFNPPYCGFDPVVRMTRKREMIYKSSDEIHPGHQTMPIGGPALAMPRAIRGPSESRRSRCAGCAVLLDACPRRDLRESDGRLRSTSTMSLLPGCEHACPNGAIAFGRTIASVVLAGGLVVSGEPDAAPAAMKPGRVGALQAGVFSLRRERGAAARARRTRKSNPLGGGTRTLECRTRVARHRQTHAADRSRAEQHGECRSRHFRRLPRSRSSHESERGDIGARTRPRPSASQDARRSSRSTINPGAADSLSLSTESCGPRENHGSDSVRKASRCSPF
jgi:NAD-dependent dihydropyrimidine dehydrogenase PreA subunit